MVSLPWTPTDRFIDRQPVSSASPKAGTPALGLYLDQNYLSGMAKEKPAFRELEPVLHAAVAQGVVAVFESEAHRIESAPRPDLPLLELLRAFSAGARFPAELAPRERNLERRLQALLEGVPGRAPRASDRLDARALAQALPRCDLVTCDAFMAEVVRRAGLDIRFRCELYAGRRADVERLRERLATEIAAPAG